MRKTTTTYLCDACGEEQASVAELARFQLVRMRRGKAMNEVAAMDLCGDCERQLLTSVDPFVPDNQKADLLDMRRDS